MWHWTTAFPTLAFCVWVQLGLAGIAVAAMPLDKRKILGINPWLKPLKFDLSTFIVLLTLGFILNGLQRFDTERAFLGGAIGLILSAENVLISLQSARGVRSHMNYATPLDRGICALMGIGAFASTLLTAAIVPFVFTGAPTWPGAVTWGVALGLLVFVVGSLEGATMATHGGHTVGAQDGVPGLPLLDWKTDAGDLRVAHFFAMHALQIFPLFGLLVSRVPVHMGIQVGFVTGFSAMYTLGVWWLFRQAMSGKPFIAR